MSRFRQPLYVSFLAVLTVTLLGSLGYLYIGEGRWTLDQCVYMTLVTVTTVGHSELQGLHEVPGARTWTIGLIVMGIGTFLYFASTLTATILEGKLQHVLRRSFMQKQIDRLSGHVIVCGVGLTGLHVVEELVASQSRLVAIELEPERIDRMLSMHPRWSVPYIVGDATDDAVLTQAGIQRAAGLVACLEDDKDNLYAVVTAKEANPNLRIVAKAIGVRAADKLRKAGAADVVSPTTLGGIRLAAAVVRPHVVEFMEEMLKEKDRNLRLEELEIPEESPLAGLPLRETGIRHKGDTLVVAIRNPHKKSYEYNPGPNQVLEAGTTLIVLTQAGMVQELRKGVRAGFR
jgi:voltage-gated potassium channel